MKWFYFLRQFLPTWISDFSGAWQRVWKKFLGSKDIRNERGNKSCLSFDLWQSAGKAWSLDIDQIESKSLSDLPIHRPHSICVLVYLCTCVFVYLYLHSCDIDQLECQTLSDLPIYLPIVPTSVFLDQDKNFNTGIRVKLKKWFQHACNVHLEM